MEFKMFDEMIKYITEHKKELPKELKIPDRMMGNKIFHKLKDSIYMHKIKFANNLIENYELQRTKHILSPKNYLRLFKTQEILSLHENIVVCKIEFTEQLVAFLEQTLGSENWYVLFLREYIRKEGEDFEDYINKWARRCIIDYNVMTEEQLDELHRQTTEYNKEYHKTYRKKNR